MYYFAHIKLKGQNFLKIYKLIYTFIFIFIKIFKIEKIFLKKVLKSI